MTRPELPTGRRVPARLIPAPAAASPALQQAVANEKPFAVAAYPQDNAGWQTLFGCPTARAKASEALAAAHGLGIALWEIGGVPCFLVGHAEAPLPAGPILLNLHGGGYVTGSGVGGTMEAVLAARASGLPVVAVDYRLAPDHPFPAAIEDALKVWRHLAGTRDPSWIGVVGTSSGGALCLSLVQHEARAGHALPGAVAALSPWSDLSKTGDSYFLNDLGLHRYEGLLAEMARLYAAGADLTDPGLSPVYGEFRGFPPTFLASGTRDLFLSNTIRVHERLDEAGATTSFHVIEGLPHAYHLDPRLPESKALFDKVARFFARHLGATARHG